ncbi:B-cell receptor CD22-like [Denticeps clupeoides]|uniref:B-cell receptor CD22-like n=1 Tax=Denticeps clupeoides TaxID=299321 RepID=UPI0010A2AEB1|nr:B-cell receptor CD22-like [Denticeps clupeoides]
MNKFNFSDSPKNTTVLGAPPAEIPEGGSVTLSCSSDANPPVQNYAWFKENVTSPVAAGQNFTITNFTSAQVGLYSCQARNEVGVQKSTAVLLAFKAHKPASPTWILYAVITVAAAVGLSCLITVCFLWYRKEKKDDTERDVLRKDCGHSAASNQDDVQYASIKETRAAAEDDVQYTTVYFRPATHTKSPIQAEAESHVIYSTVHN